MILSSIMVTRWTFFCVVMVDDPRGEQAIFELSYASAWNMSSKELLGTNRDLNSNPSRFKGIEVIEQFQSYKSHIE